MTEFDRKIKKFSEDIKTPAEYDKRVEETLANLPEREPQRRKPRRYVRGIAVAAAMLFLILVVVFSTSKTEANVISTFKHSILHFFNIEEKESKDLGVEKHQTWVESKPDLFIEMKETVVDSQGIYLLVQVTAPANIELEDKITFDYYAFSEGENYNADNLISGATSCDLLEVMEGKPNVGTYVVNISPDEEIAEGSSVTACFKDLTRDPYGSEPELLVEGMWSITFTVNYTTEEEITIEGNSDMTFPFLGTTATVGKIKVTPLGMSIRSDVSNVPYDDLGISDTSLQVRIRMVDGTEQLVMSHNMEDVCITSNGSVSYDDKDGTVWQTNKFEFQDMVEVKKVIGIYIEDTYIPVE